MGDHPDIISAMATGYAPWEQEGRYDDDGWDAHLDDVYEQMRDDAMMEDRYE